jgi:hypothetical protein
MAKKSSGPDNWNHNKLRKATGKFSLRYATWFDVIEEVDVATVKSKKMHANCDNTCKIRIIAVSEVFDFHEKIDWSTPDRTGKWTVRKSRSSKDETNRLANPNFTPDAIYISGTGSHPSMAYYDGEWWIIFGILKRKIQGEKTKCYVLHNPKCVVDRSHFDNLKDNFFPGILAKEVEKWE